VVCVGWCGWCVVSVCWRVSVWGGWCVLVSWGVGVCWWVWVVCVGCVVGVVSGGLLVWML